MWGKERKGKGSTELWTERDREREIKNKDERWIVRIRGWDEKF